MPKKHENYPNKADYEPNIDKNIEDTGELPLSDPAESNATEIFRKNEAKAEDKHEKERSAFGQNKNRKE